MTKIGLISDTHGYLDESVFHHFKDCDEVWHAGDFGLSPYPSHTRKEGGLEDRVLELLDLKKLGLWQENYFSHRLNKKITFRGVYGNIDGADIRNTYPEKLFFTCEKVNVYMQHIGGYPNRYAKGVKENIVMHNSNLFISGHSHILKILYDAKLNCLHMNPGAAGKQGWHKIKTLIKFNIDGANIKDCEVVELG